MHSHRSWSRCGCRRCGSQTPDQRVDHLGSVLDELSQNPDRLPVNGAVVVPKDDHDLGLVLERVELILTHGGRLVVVHPNAGHLEHLRRTYGLLDVDPDKEQRLATQLSDFAVTRHTVAYRVDGTASQVADLVAMGPNAFHGRVVQSAPSRIDVDVSVLVCEAPPAREP